MMDPHDSPAEIAATLQQLADEVAGNETRPAANDIANRLRHAAHRIANLQNEFDHAVQQGVDAVASNVPVKPPFEAPFQAGQPITATHPRMTMAQGDGDEGEG